MTNFSYNIAVPATNNDPSVDQPDMLINTANGALIWDVDHVGFNTNNGGTHLQTTFISKNPAGAQTDPSSVLYTGNGTASTKADLFFRNQNGIFRPNMIKAAGVFTTVAVSGGVAIDMGVNVASISYSTVTNAVTINLTANAVNGTTVMVFVNAGSGTTPGWTFAANTLTLSVVTPTAGRKISFAILQV